MPSRKRPLDVRVNRLAQTIELVDSQAAGRVDIQNVLLVVAKVHVPVPVSMTIRKSRIGGVEVRVDIGDIFVKNTRLIFEVNLKRVGDSVAGQFVVRIARLHRGPRSQR